MPITEKLEKKHSWGLFLVTVICYLIVCIDQCNETVLIESTASLNALTNGRLVNFFLLASVPGALILAFWSDFHCRRKTMLFALIMIALSGVLICLYNIFGYKWLGITSLYLKAILGNAIPIGYAILADITPRKWFRALLAGAIASYSFGIWVPIKLRPSEGENFLLSLIVLLITLLLIGIAFFWLKDSYFDKVKFKKNDADVTRFIHFFKKELKIIGLFFASCVIFVSLLLFLFSEVSYYQFLFRGEFLKKNLFYSSQAGYLAAGYYIGTFILIAPDLIRKKKHIRDLTWIGIGVILSLISVFSIVLFQYLNLENPILYSTLIVIFSAGFAFFDPTIFAALSRIRPLHDQGKIFGSLDSTESLANFASSFTIQKTKTKPRDLVMTITLSMFVCTFICYLWFVKIMKKTLKKSA